MNTLKEPEQRPSQARRLLLNDFDLAVETKRAFRSDVLYIGIYTDLGAIHSGEYRDYKVVLGYGRSFEKYSVGDSRAHRGSLVCLRRVPQVWNELKSAVPDIAQEFPVIGYIKYQFFKGGEMTHAITFDYQPKKNLSRIYGKRFAYFIEAMTTNHLRKMGITHISSTAYPLGARERQLHEAELPVGSYFWSEPVTVDDWLEGLGRGIRRHLQNVRQARASNALLSKSEPVYI